VCGLAFLAFLALVGVRTVAVRDSQAWAFPSPNSPLDALRDTGSAQSPLSKDDPASGPDSPGVTSPLPLPEKKAVEVETEPAVARLRWRLPLGIGVIALGLVFVMGGLIYLLRRQRTHGGSS